MNKFRALGCSSTVIVDFVGLMGMQIVIVTSSRTSLEFFILGYGEVSPVKYLSFHCTYFCIKVRWGVGETEMFEFMQKLDTLFQFIPIIVMEY